MKANDRTLLLPYEHYRDVDCAYAVRLPVLGITTAFATNSPAVLAAIHETYGAWASPGDAAAWLPTTQARVRIIEHDRPLAAAAVVKFRHRATDRMRLLIDGSDCAGIADANRLESVAYIAPGTTDDHVQFVEGLLEPLTLFLLGALDRQPLHGAAIARNGVAIILAGASGAGKSTLAYAAQRLGFSTLADEPVYVQLEPSLRVWGRRSRLHLTPETRAHFPELNGIAATILPTGKTKLIVDSNAQTPRYADHAGICILRRGGGTGAQLERISPQQAVAALTMQLDPGYDLFADSIGERILRIAERGAWSLRVTDAPADALPFLDHIATELEQTR